MAICPPLPPPGLWLALGHSDPAHQGSPGRDQGDGQERPRAGRRRRGILAGEPLARAGAGGRLVGRHRVGSEPDRHHVGAVHCQGRSGSRYPGTLAGASVAGCAEGRQPCSALVLAPVACHSPALPARSTSPGALSSNRPTTLARPTLLSSILPGSGVDFRSSRQGHLRASADCLPAARGALPSGLGRQLHPVRRDASVIALARNSTLSQRAQARASNQLMPHTARMPCASCSSQRIGCWRCSPARESSHSRCVSSSTSEARFPSRWASPWLSHH